MDILWIQYFIHLFYIFLIHEDEIKNDIMNVFYFNILMV